MWAQIITIKRTKGLKTTSVCVHWIYLIHRFYQLELNYWNKITFPRHSNYWDCTCILKGNGWPRNVNSFFIYSHYCHVFKAALCFPARFAVLYLWLRYWGDGCWRGRWPLCGGSWVLFDWKAHYWWGLLVMGNPNPLWPHGDGGLDDLGPDDGVAPVWWGFLLWRPWLGALVGGDWMELVCDLSWQNDWTPFK